MPYSMNVGRKKINPFKNRTQDSLFDVMTFIIVIIIIILFVFRCFSFEDKKNLTVPEEQQKIMIMNEKGGLKWIFI